MSDADTIGTGETGKDGKPNPGAGQGGTGSGTAPHVERIGIIFVHGIGEQKRFTHLDGELRPLLDALKRRPAEATIEITPGSASTLNADQDTWNTEGAPVRAVVKDNGVEKHLHFHEVWWADVNERYTFTKQVQFWLWGLAMWALPLQKEMRAKGVMEPPEFPDPPRGRAKKKGTVLTTRVQLFAVSNLFLMGAFSIGLVLIVTKRILGYQAPNLVRVFVNYLSSVRLYTQPERAGGGFLDAYMEPPRASVRRRMIRTIADVALKGDYDRWYIFGHSLGSVVSFNGVMENNLAIPNYIEEKKWLELCAAGKAGAGRNGECVNRSKPMLPVRPLWLKDNDVVYRDELFKRFAGLLTYGSPLDKFAMLWPAQVPINSGEPIQFYPDGRKDPASTTARTPDWVNVYDPTDPVGASLQAFGVPGDKAGVPSPVNYGYRAGNLWLASHLAFLKVHPKKDNERSDELSDALVDWVLGGKPFNHSNNGGRWFRPDEEAHDKRMRWRHVQQILGYVIVTLLAAMSLPFILTMIKEFADVIARKVTVPSAIATPYEWIKYYAGGFFARVWDIVTQAGDLVRRFVVWALPDVLLGSTVFWVVFGVFVTVVVAGLIGGGIFDKPDKRKPGQPPGQPA